MSRPKWSHCTSRIKAFSILPPASTSTTRTPWRTILKKIVAIDREGDGRFLVAVDHCGDQAAFAHAAGFVRAVCAARLRGQGNGFGHDNDAPGRCKFPKNRTPRQGAGCSGGPNRKGYYSNPGAAEQEGAEKKPIARAIFHYFSCARPAKTVLMGVSSPRSIAWSHHSCRSSLLRCCHAEYRCQNPPVFRRGGSIGHPIDCRRRL